MTHCSLCNKKLIKWQFKYCSRHCTITATKKSKERNKKISISKIGSKNPMWVGDSVSYAGLHLWVSKRIPKPDVCESCHVKPPIDLANKGEYSRDLSNWEWLCRRCHMIKDGRINRMIDAIEKYRSNKKYEITCLLCGSKKKTHRKDTRFCSKKCLSDNGNNKRLGKPHF